MTPKTKVIFRMFQGEVVALFPREAVTAGNPLDCLSYVHFGQHGAADPQIVISGSRPATPAEYRVLAKELRAIGYALDIRQRTGPADLAERRAQLQAEPDKAMIKIRLDELRKELRAERMSYGELLELQSLAEYIDPDDVELREAAGLPEF